MRCRVNLNVDLIKANFIMETAFLNQAAGPILMKNSMFQWQMND